MNYIDMIKYVDDLMRHNLFEECLVQPYQNVQPDAYECKCHNCHMPIRIPLVIDKEFAYKANEVLAKIMKKTGYTKEMIAEIATEAYIEMARRKATHNNH